jgi:CRISPR-associated protein Csx10
MSERFRVRLTMESDWHVGSGMGRPGSVDRLIARDADDLPYVPGKTLHGIWRDACERLCRALDGGEVGGWSRLVDRLFGSQPALGLDDLTSHHANAAEVPIPAAVQIRAARIRPSLRKQLVGSDQRLRSCLTFVKPGVKIDARSGAAMADFLRFEELGRKGTVLEAECCLFGSDQSTTVLARALLAASSLLVERLGGKRRRGLGRCRLDILSQDGNHWQPADAIDWLKNQTTAPSWLSPVMDVDLDGAANVGASDDSAANETWVRVPLRLELSSPVAVSCRTTGNVVESLDFVPGSYLLPHVTRALLGKGVDVRAAVQAGSVCVLPAYPEVEGTRGLPVPMALFAPKGMAAPLQPGNRARLVNRLLDDQGNHGTQLKQLREGYVSQNPTEIYKTPISVHTHNTVHDKSQRPTSDVGGVYTYEAIAPVDRGQPVVLRSELRLRQTIAQALPDNWWASLEGDVALGRSKKDDYGSARIVAEQPQDATQGVANAGGTLHVWLVSDTLLRNSRLRSEPTAECLGETLSRLLGVTLELRSSGDGRLDEFVRVRRLDSWHVGWGLPRPSLVALQAGSCAVFEVKDGVLDAGKLSCLQSAGIGERTAEGYGQVLLNHSLITTPLDGNAAVLAQDRPAINGDAVPDGDAQVDQLAVLVERECWKQEIRLASLKVAGATGERERILQWSTGAGRPTMSQLGGLRGQLGALVSWDARVPVLTWLGQLQGNANRADKWPADSLEKVRGILDNRDRIWEILQPQEAWPSLTRNAPMLLKEQLWALAVRSFFDACIRAHKRETEGRSGS